MSEDDLVEYIQTPEGRALWLSILAKIPGVETMDTEEVERFIVEAIRAYRQ